LTSICENRSCIAVDGDELEALVADGDCAASSAFHVSDDSAPLCPQFPDVEDVAEADVLDVRLKGFEFWVTPVVGFVDDDFDDVSDDNRSSADDAAPAKARYMAILPPPRMRGPAGVQQLSCRVKNACKIDIF
jgi:hypothetical protein